MQSMHLKNNFLFFDTHGYEKVFLHTVGSYIQFMIVAIENLNRYYSGDSDMLAIRLRLKELYKKYKEELNFTMEGKICIRSMLLPVNANIIPNLIKKKNKIRKMYAKYIKNTAQIRK